MSIEQDRSAYVPGFAYYDDNISLLKATLNLVLRRVGHLDSIRMLSLGVGHRYTVKGLLEALGDRLAHHVIVEGSAEIIDLFNREIQPPAHVELVQAYFEDFVTAEKFDVIEMGFVLEHVMDPELVLRRFSRFLAPGGRMMISTPNANSLHRLIGKQAGLLDDLHALSEADVALGHRHYFDADQLAALIEGCGLRVTSRAGLMLKPFTTAQLASLGLDDRIRDAMNEVGYALPDICNGIFIEACACD
jgi:SAM-dependent methyltransferase